MSTPGDEKTDERAPAAGADDRLTAELLVDLQDPLTSIRGFAQILREKSEPGLRDHALAILAHLERIELLLARHRRRTHAAAEAKGAVTAPATSPVAAPASSFKAPTPMPFPAPVSSVKAPTPMPFPAPVTSVKPPTPGSFPAPAASAEPPTPAPSPAPACAARPPTPVPFPMPALARRSILVVDDEEVMRSLLVSLLEPEGYRIHLAESGDQALQMIAKQRFDLIISDKNLPGSATGLEVAKAARARHLDTPVILITGYASLETAQEGLEIGLVDYLEKPFDDIAEVRRRIREVLEQEQRAPMPTGPRPGEERRLVVLVEDRPDDAAKICEAVASAGGRPKVATTVVQALGFVSTEHAAGVILSLDLKEGTPTRESLRQLRSCADALVTVSERTSMEQTVVAIRMGASACLPRALASPQALARELVRLFPLGTETK